MQHKGFHVFGVPLWGVILPYIGHRRIPLNRNGSYVDQGAGDLLDEKGFYYVKPLVFEWFGAGLPLTQSRVYLTSNDEAVDNPPFATAG